MERGRNDSGRYNDRIEPDTVLELFEERDDRAEPLTASDVVDEMDIARRTAHNKLNALTERGVLETKKVGARGRVWWTPIRDSRDVHSKGVERSEPEGGRSYERTPEPAENEQQARETDATLDDALEGWKPGNGAKDTERRREIGRQALEWLREQPTPVQKADFESALYERTSLEDQGAKSWWVRVVRPGLDNAAEREYVDSSGRTYEWIGE